MSGGYFTRLQSQVHLFVRLARSSGLETDWISLISNKQNSMRPGSLQKLDNLLKNVIVSPPLKPTLWKGESFAETTYDPVTMQTIFRFEIPKEARLKLKENALKETNGDQIKAKALYKEKFNALKSDLVRNHAIKQVRPRNPPLRTGLNEKSEAVQLLNKSIKRSEEQSLELFELKLSQLKLGSDEDKAGFVALQRKLRKHASNLDFSRALEPLSKLFSSSQPLSAPTSLKQYCDLVAPYVVKGADPSILYDILSTKIGDGNFLNMLKVSKEFSELVNTLPDRMQEHFRSLEIKLEDPSSKNILQGLPFKNILVDRYLRFVEDNKLSPVQKIDKQWTVSSLSQWKSLKCDHALNWDSFENHHYTHEFASTYRPWLGALARAHGIFGESPLQDVTAQPFWRVLHGFMERELEYLFNFLPVYEKRLDKVAVLIKQVERHIWEIYNLSSYKMLAEMPEERERLEWNLLRGRYLTAPFGPLAPPPKDIFRTVY